MIAITELYDSLLIMSETAFHRIPLSYLRDCDISLYTKWSILSPFKRRIILHLGKKEYSILLPNDEIKPAIEMIAEKLFSSSKKEEVVPVPLEEEEEGFRKL